jgi:serine/threonine protein kinase
MNGRSSTLRSAADATMRDACSTDDPSKLLDKIAAEWREADAPDLVRTLEEHPQLLHDTSVLLNLALEEYKTRRAATVDLDLAQHCHRFHKFGSVIERSIFRQLETQQYIEEHPELLDLFRPPTWPEVGETIGGFLFLRELGRGGIARVFLCRERDIGDRLVVVKVTPTTDVEATLLGRLKHPNIIPIYSTASIVGRNLNYLCMPYCGRSTLADLLDVAFQHGIPTDGSLITTAGQRWEDSHSNNRPPRWSRFIRRTFNSSYVDRVLRISIQIADALEYAHSQGIVHSDLKPSNVLLTPEGVPLLLDFNLSQDVLNVVGLRGGTLPYMPPEHLERVASDAMNRDQTTSLDPRSEIYSFGALVFELLTGATPIEITSRHSDPSVAAQHLLDKLPTLRLSIRRRNCFVSRRLESIVLHCLAISPVDRPGSIRQVQQELKKEITWLSKLKRNVESRPVVYSSVATATMSAAVITGAYFAHRPPAYLTDFNRGYELLSEGNAANASDFFRDALRKNPEYVPAKFQLGRAYLAAENLDAAIQQFGELAHEVRHVHSMVYVGYCFNLKGSATAAVEWYNRAKAYGAQSVELYNNLGASYLDTHSYTPAAQFENAKTNLISALEINPETPTVHLNLIRLELARAALEPNHNPISAWSHIMVVLPECHSNNAIRVIVEKWWNVTNSRIGGAPLDSDEIEAWQQINNNLRRFMTLNNSTEPLQDAKQIIGESANRTQQANQHNQRTPRFYLEPLAIDFVD